MVTYARMHVVHIAITAYLIAHASTSGTTATNLPHFGPGAGFILWMMLAALEMKQTSHNVGTMGWELTTVGPVKMLVSSATQVIQEI